MTWMPLSAQLTSVPGGMSHNPAVCILAWCLHNRGHIRRGTARRPLKWNQSEGVFHWSVGRVRFWLTFTLCYSLLTACSSTIKCLFAAAAEATGVISVQKHFPNFPFNVFNAFSHRNIKGVVWFLVCSISLRVFFKHSFIIHNDVQSSWATVLQPLDAFPSPTHLDQKAEFPCDDVIDSNHLFIWYRCVGDWMYLKVTGYF